MLVWNSSQARSRSRLYVSCTHIFAHLPWHPSPLLPSLLTAFAGEQPLCNSCAQESSLLLRSTGCNVPTVTHEWRGRALFQPFQGGPSWGEAVNEAGGMGLWDQATGVQLGWAVYWWHELPTLSSWFSTLNIGSWSKGLSSSPSCLILLLAECSSSGVWLTCSYSVSLGVGI